MLLDNVLQHLYFLLFWLFSEGPPCLGILSTEATQKLPCRSSSSRRKAEKLNKKINQPVNHGNEGRHHRRSASGADGIDAVAKAQVLSVPFGGGAAAAAVGRRGGRGYGADGAATAVLLQHLQRRRCRRGCGRGCGFRVLHRGGVGEAGFGSRLKSRMATEEDGRGREEVETLCDRGMSTQIPRK